jgi:hypothetical protein
MQRPLAGTDTGLQSTASRVEIFTAQRPINLHGQAGSRCLILQLLNSCLLDSLLE